MAEALRPAGGAGRVGRLRLTLRVDGRGKAFVEAPWKLFGPVGAPGEIPTYYLSNVTAGIFQGDDLDGVIDVGPGVAVRILTTSATRVHSMTGGRASQRLTFRLGAEASLFYRPHALIPYSGADYIQETAFALEPGASLVATDLLSAGRVAHGEQFAFERLRQRVQISLDGRLILSDRACLEPALRHPACAGGMERGFTALGSLYLAGRAALAGDLDRLAARLEQESDVLAGVSKPYPGLTVARVMGPGVEAVDQAVNELLEEWICARGSHGGTCPDADGGGCRWRGIDSRTGRG